MLLKLLTGELRVGVSQTLVVRALAQAAALPATTIAARLMGDWTPTAELVRGAPVARAHRRRPVAAVSVLSRVAAGRSPVESLGAARGLADRVEVGRHPRAAGARAAAQCTSGRAAKSSSRIAFPEIAAAATRLPDGTVLDGEVLAFRDDRPLPFSALQQRIGRQKQVAQMARAVPVVFMAYDLLEDGGVDMRAPPARRAPRRAPASRIVRCAGVLRTSARSSRRRRGTNSRRCARDRARSASKG